MYFRKKNKPLIVVRLAAQQEFDTVLQRLPRVAAAFIRYVKEQENSPFHAANS
jgi:hypothetical protein